MKNTGTVLFKILNYFLLLIGLLLIVPAILGLLFLFGFGLTYETENPDNYLEIRGNYDNESPREFIASFFPKEIEDSFSQVVYHYKAEKEDSIACECYLEFVIEDPVDYKEFLERYVQRDLCTVFPYDTDFQEQSIANYIVLETLESDEQLAVYIMDDVCIGKILYSDAQQRIIFVAIQMCDGGCAYTTEFNYFFSRFQIDPMEYAQSEPAQEYYEKFQRGEISH